MNRRPKILVLVLAGGAGGRLELLTADRAKPAVPFAGVYRLIDFPLSNCRNAGLADVWVAEQFNPFALSDHLANGRPWDLDRTMGGLLLLHPHLGAGREGWHRGTADAISRNAPLLRDFGADALVVLSADAIYRLDYRDVVDDHLDGGADVTMVTTEVAAEDAGRYGVVHVDGERVTDYAYKPDSPASSLVSNEVFVFDPARLLETLSELDDEAGDEGLTDLGDALLPRLVKGGGARAHRMAGYWRDVGTLDAYWSAHQDLLGADPVLDLGDLAWPILSRGTPYPPARVLGDARLDDALLSPGVLVRGTVERSVLGPGVVVEPGATVRGSILLDDVVVRAGAVVQRAVLDESVEVGEDAEVGAADGDLTLVGRGQRIAAGAGLEAGGRLPRD